jgi:hypothetical protein
VADAPADAPIRTSVAGAVTVAFHVLAAALIVIVSASDGAFVIVIVAVTRSAAQAVNAKRNRAKRCFILRAARNRGSVIIDPKFQLFGSIRTCENDCRAIRVVGVFHEQGHALRRR